MNDKKTNVFQGRFNNDERVYPDYEKIRKLIKKRGMKLKQVSLAIGMSGSHISTMACGNNAMAYKIIKKIAAALDVRGANKLLASPDGKKRSAVDDNCIVELKEDMSTDERIAEALEAIAEALNERWGKGYDVKSS